MRELKESDIFMKEINKNNQVYTKITAMLTKQEPTTVLLNAILFPEIKKKIVDKKKEETTTKMAEAIAQGRIWLLATGPERRLSDIIPFFAFNKDGVRHVGVNMTSIVKVTKLNDGSLEYELGDNVNKAFVLLRSAYLLLDCFDKRVVMNDNVMYNSALLWAEMFCKPLYNVVGLNNIDLYEAFKFMAMKFFLVYYLETSESIAEGIAMRYIKRQTKSATKNQLLLNMIDVIEYKQINIYSGVEAFLRTLFNDEISHIKGLRINNKISDMGLGFYLREFTQVYGANALLALCSFPYFVYVMTAAAGKCNLVKDKSFDRVFKDNAGSLNKLLTEVTKM